MTYTYAGTLATDLDKVRFYVGDVVSGTGIRPSGANFTDEEIGGLITTEGSWQKAVAAILDTLAAEYARFVNITLGQRREDMGQAAQRYRELAERWRADYGLAGTSSRMGTRAFTRADGYSDDIAADEA